MKSGKSGKSKTSLKSKKSVSKSQDRSFYILEMLKQDQIDREKREKDRKRLEIS